MTGLEYGFGELHTDHFGEFRLLAQGSGGHAATETDDQSAVRIGVEESGQVTHKSGVSLAFRSVTHHASGVHHQKPTGFGISYGHGGVAVVSKVLYRIGLETPAGTPNRQIDRVEQGIGREKEGAEGKSGQSFDPSEAASQKKQRDRHFHQDQE